MNELYELEQYFQPVKGICEDICLYGSRSTTFYKENSDWDFAVVCESKKTLNQLRLFFIGAAPDLTKICHPRFSVDFYQTQDVDKILPFYSKYFLFSYHWRNHSYLGILGRHKGEGPYKADEEDRIQYLLFRHLMFFKAFEDYLLAPSRPALQGLVFSGIQALYLKDLTDDWRSKRGMFRAIIEKSDELEQLKSFKRKLETQGELSWLAQEVHTSFNLLLKVGGSPEHSAPDERSLFWTTAQLIENSYSSYVDSFSKCIYGKLLDEYYSNTINEDLMSDLFIWEG